MQDESYTTLGDIAMRELTMAQDAWREESFPHLDKEEALTRLTQQQCILVERPGGRLTVHVVLTPRSRSKGEEMYYARYQMVPGEGYVQVFKR